jgi:hypothetical protein
MGTPIDYIYENKLEWQPALKGALGVAGRYGYRGTLVVTEGKSKPETMLKQAIAISDEEKMLFFAGELASFDDFEAAFARYKSVLSPETLTTLFVSDITSDAVFDYEGVTVYAFSLDESSVWNELVEHADMDKRELKRMGAEAKLDAIYDELKGSTLRATPKSYEETCALKF